MTQDYTRPHVLVVEDHPVFRRFLLSWLSRSYRVHAVADGFEGLRWLQAGNQPDVVVLDMEMPRITGEQFLRNLRFSGLFTDLPVVAVSSVPEEDVWERVEQYNVSAVFPKPYQPAALLSAIDAAIEPVYA